VHYDGKAVGEVMLGVPGLHNVRNALAALACGIGPWGLTVAQMAPGLAAFVGAERRFQRRGTARGVEVVDDYAHHPTEVRATLEAAREAYPGRRIVAAFQPHLFTRTRDFAAEFAEALAQADVVVLADIYPGARAADRRRDERAGGGRARARGPHRCVDRPADGHGACARRAGARGGRGAHHRRGRHHAHRPRTPRAAGRAGAP
jgi:UDP-N-acetylmuramate-alanine ligase